MNIFLLDRDITKCAQAHVDRHVNKMILESAQLMASVIHIVHPDWVDEIPDLYRLTHKNHPCAVWLRSDFSHYLYLNDLMEELNLEAKYRYGHTKDHLSLVKVRNWPVPELPLVKFTDPPKCVHDDFKQVPNVVDAYRQYYIRDKADIAKWTKREPPEWLTQTQTQT